MPTRCDVCNGKKQVIGMGGMIKSCSACNATGWKKEAAEMDKRSKEYRELKKIKEG